MLHQLILGVGSLSICRFSFGFTIEEYRFTIVHITIDPKRNHKLMEYAIVIVVVQEFVCGFIVDVYKAISPMRLEIKEHSVDFSRDNI